MYYNQKWYTDGDNSGYKRVRIIAKDAQGRTVYTSRTAPKRFATKIKDGDLEGAINETRKKVKQWATEEYYKAS